MFFFDDLSFIFRISNNLSDMFRFNANFDCILKHDL